MFKAFTISNSMEGFNDLYAKIKSVSDDLSKLKVGLEATGHYSYNLLGFLLDKCLPTYVINPLHTNLFRKSQTLRKTKTDKVDAHTIAKMLLSDENLKPYSDTLYHNEELKSLTRYRFDKVRERAALKNSIARLVNILFPEIEKLVPTLHMKSIYAFLLEFPSARHIAKAMELKHTIELIQIISSEIDEIEFEIKRIMNDINSPILSIPGISYHMGAMIIAEIGDFSNFSSPDKILAYSGMSPSTYQSGHLTNCYAHMEKRGSRYLRYALYNATQHVCRWDKTFADYLAKKRSEGKHYNVAISHATKKLLRVLYHLEKTGELYQIA